MVHARADENLGVADVEASLLEEAQAMTAEVLGDARTRVAAAHGHVIGGSAIVACSTIHSPYSVVNAANHHAAEATQQVKAVEERKEARAEQAGQRSRDAAEALAARQDLVCKVRRSTHHRGGPGWLVCECGYWRVCHDFKSTLPGRVVVSAHGGTYS